MGISEEIKALPQGWMFCLAKPGGADGLQKQAYERGWPQGLTVDQVQAKLSHGRCMATMIGAVLGEVSGGLVAIDHDGDGADIVLRDVFGIEQLPETATITSGKPGRWCAFFTVPEAEWPGLRKVVWDSPVKGEQLEVRWGNPKTGHQQIVAGIHPETGNAYQWLRHPRLGIAELPAQILKVWRQKINGNQESTPKPAKALQRAVNVAPSERLDLIPIESLLAKAHRGLAASGAPQGNRNATAFDLACDAIGVEDWISKNGYQTDTTAEDLLREFCNRCDPPIPNSEAETIWKSANKRTPAACLSEEKLRGCVEALEFKARQQSREEARSRIAAQSAPVNRGNEAKATDEHAFQFLGFNKDLYYYLPRGQKQVISITAAGHNERRLLTLAPLDWWSDFFSKETKSGPVIDWQKAISWLYQQQHSQGVYDPRRVRGRGCWIDDGRTVIHLGEKIMVDGDQVEVGRVKSRYIYEQGARLADPSLSNPLGLDEAAWLFETVKMCRWEHPGSAAMLAGWIVLAPICGALRWRPHCWIVGGAGSGKSSVLALLTKPLLGEMETSVLGSSTEAGLRQNLGSDAIPVMMDEAEQAQAKDEERLQAVMELARASSSETGAKTLKGTAGGTGQEYLIRSMFLLSSITSSLKQGSDKSRFALLQLRNPCNDTPEEVALRQEQWNELRQRLDKITPEMGRRLIARTVKRLPQLLREVELFSDVASELFGSRRAGDQFGFLLAGAYSLTTDEEATLETATAFVGQQNWDEFLEPSRSAADHERCLSRILEARVRTGLMTEPEMPLGELVELATHYGLASKDINEVQADKLLQRHGLKIDKQAGQEARVLVSANHTAIGKILDRSPWSNDWRSVLKQVPGAELTQSVYFRGGHQSRAVSIPLGAVLKTS